MLWFSLVPRSPAAEEWAKKSLVLGLPSMQLLSIPPSSPYGVNFPMHEVCPVPSLSRSVVDALRVLGVVLQHRDQVPPCVLDGATGSLVVACLPVALEYPGKLRAAGDFREPCPPEEIPSRRILLLWLKQLFSFLSFCVALPMGFLLPVFWSYGDSIIIVVGNLFNGELYFTAYHLEIFLFFFLAFLNKQ